MKHKTALTLITLLTLLSLTCLCPGGAVSVPDASEPYGQPAPPDAGDYQPPAEDTYPPETEEWPAPEENAQVEQALAAVEFYDFGALETYPNEVSQAFIHLLPAEQILDNVIVSPVLFYSDTGGGQFSARLVYTFQHLDDQPVSFTYRVFVPKAFAVYIDEVEITPPFSRLINPDIEGDVDIQMDAGTRTKDVLIQARRTYSEAEVRQIKDPAIAYEVGLKTCDSLSGNERLYCYLRLMEQVRGPGVTAETMLSNCARFASNPKQAITCEAKARSKPSLCDQIQNDDVERKFCQSVVITEVCRKVSDPAERNNCTVELAVKTGNHLICSAATNADQRNYCLALVSKDQFYCKLINDVALKDKCKRATAKVDEHIFSNTCDWFPDNQQAALCQRLHGLPAGMELVASGGDCRLRCEFRGAHYQNIVVEVDLFESSAVASQRFDDAYGKNGYAGAKEQFMRECSDNCSLDTSLEDIRMTVIYDFMASDSMPEHAQIRRWRVIKNAIIYIYDHYDYERNLSMIDELEESAVEIFEEAYSAKTR